MIARAMVGLALVALAQGCRAAGPPALLRIERESSGASTTLALVAAPGVRINARIKPALELPDGLVLRFDSPHLSADSAYFTRPPIAVLSGSGRPVAGTLRASVCSEDELVCRSVTLEL